MINLGELQTGHPKIDAMTTAFIALGLGIGSMYTEHLVILTVQWQVVFQNLAITFSIIASILSVNKSTRFLEKIKKWLKK